MPRRATAACSTRAIATETEEQAVRASSCGDPRNQRLLPADALLRHHALVGPLHELKVVAGRLRVQQPGLRLLADVEPTDPPDAP